MALSAVMAWPASVLLISTRQIEREGSRATLTSWVSNETNVIATVNPTLERTTLSRDLIYMPQQTIHQHQSVRIRKFTGAHGAVDERFQLVPKTSPGTCEGDHDYKRYLQVNLY